MATGRRLWKKGGKGCKASESVCPVLHEGGAHREALEDKWAEIGPAGVDGRRVAGRTRADDDHVLNCMG